MSGCGNKPEEIRCSLGLKKHNSCLWHSLSQQLIALERGETQIPYYYLYLLKYFQINLSYFGMSIDLRFRLSIFKDIVMLIYIYCYILYGRLACFCAVAYHMGCTLRNRVFEHITTEKTHIGLRICAVWLGSSLSAIKNTGCYRMYELKAKARIILCACTGWS